MFLIWKNLLRTKTCSVSCTMFKNIQYLHEKGRDLTQSFDKSPYTDRKIQKATWQHKNATKTSITQRLQTDLGRPVWVTKDTQLVWLNRFTESQQTSIMRI